MTSQIQKPMLAASVEDLDVLRLPLIATRKIDGIRCLIINGKAYARSLKPIRNIHIARTLSQLPDGMDGEIVAGATFQDVTSSVMSRDGEPAFVYHVFDWVHKGVEEPYHQRIERLFEFCAHNPMPHLMYVNDTFIDNRAMLDAFIEAARYEGEEGICLRHPDGAYKNGRSTIREHGLLKVKFMADSEARITGFEEAMENTNEQKLDELGRMRRSGHKANKVPKGTVGTILARDLVTGQNIRVGTGKGLNDELKQAMWDNPKQYIGRIFKYQHQAVGQKDAPRIPSFQGFRSTEDM